MTEFIVKQGDTSATINVGSSSMISTTGWTCTLRVLDDTGTALINRVVADISPSKDKFLVSLTPTETGALAVETYRMIIELTNAALTPPFNLEDQHILVINPQMEIGDLTGLIQLTKGSNSFADLETLILKLSQMPALSAAQSADRNQLKGALISAYENIGLVTTNFEVFDATLATYKTSTRDFTLIDIDALTAVKQAALIRAQLVEGNSILGGNPIEDRRREGMMSDRIGDSTSFFRTSLPLEMPVYRDTAMALKGYIIWTKQIGRV